MVKIVVIARCERVQEGQSYRGDDGLISTHFLGSSAPTYNVTGEHSIFKFDASRTSKR